VTNGVVYEKLTCSVPVLLAMLEARDEEIERLIGMVDSAPRFGFSDDTITEAINIPKGFDNKKEKDAPF